MNFKKGVFLTAMLLTLLVNFNIMAQELTEWQKEFESTPRQPKTGRTLVFAQAQLKYGLNLLNGPTYIGRWVDRPLFVDPEIPQDTPREGCLWFNDYVKMQQILKQYGLDGFIIFAENSSCAPIYDKTNRSPVQDFQLASLLYPIPSAKDDISRKIAIVGKMLECKKSLFIDGKLVIILNSSEFSTEYWKNLFDELRRRYGERFIFISDIIMPAKISINEWGTKYRKDKITLQDVRNIKEHLRQQLRLTDGIIIGDIGLGNGKRDFNKSFYKDFLIKLFRSVLSEPEFKNKYFALSATIGHENCCAIGYVLSHDGTKTLRNSFEAAMHANPDIITIPEWDEENENTCLRPTVYNGLSSMRIMRYYMAKIKNQPVIPMPGDNINIPDLTISYRKLLCLGEKIKIELLNVPDSEKEETYTVKLTLKNIDGKTLKEFAPVTFNSNEMKDNTIEVPSEDFAQYQVLLPSLEIRYRGKISTFEEGLHYIELRPTWNWDYKWVKQPLRDLIIPEKAVFKQIENSDRLIKTFEGKIISPEELNYVEVLDNDDIVYIYGNDLPREDQKGKVLRFTFQSNKNVPQQNLLNGTITVENANGIWKADTHYNFNISYNDSIMKFINCNLSAIWPRDLFVSIPAGDVDKAVLNIDIPGIYTGKIPVRKIIDEQVFVAAGEKGVCSINRFIRQINYPKHLKDKAADFSVDVIPDLKSSVIHMEAITKSGKTFRSKPVLMLHPKPNAAQQEIIVFSDSANKPVKLKIDADRITTLDYAFTPEHGAALVCNAGRAMWGILGGYCPQVTMRNGGESGYGSPFGLRPYPLNATKCFPDWVKEENGEYSLRFDGVGTYAVLPQGTIPRRSAFEISMMIMPEDADKKQLIIGNREYYPGFIGSVFLENGFLKITDILPENYNGVSGGVDSEKSSFRDKIKIPSGKWSSIKITYDQENFVFEVNGNKSEKFKYSGPGLYDTVTVVGGFGQDWFKGKIKNLKISHIAD